VEAVRWAAREVYDLAVELGFSHFTWPPPFLLAWSELYAPAGGPPAIELGDFDSSQRVIAQRGGSNMGYYYCLHAETLILRERPGDAWRALDEGLRLTQARGVSIWIEEVYRLQGELLLHAKSAEAEGRFQTALELARCHGSRAMELRVALSLGRLWQSQGRTQAARDLVAQARQGFTGGLASGDLREAGEFLDSCSTEEK